MRMRTQCIAVVGVSLSLASLALAQPPQGRPQRGGGMPGGRMSPAALLANEDVQKELKLTEEQKEKIKELAPARRGPGGGEPSGGGRPQRGQGGGQGGGQGNAEAVDKFIKESLTAEQQKRFEQIRIQTMGVQAFAEEKVQSALHFTDEQKAKVKSLLEDLAKERRELAPQRGQGGGGGGGDPREAMEKIQALTRQYTEKVHGLLTAEQKSAWDKLIGAKFELRPRRPAQDR